MQELEKSIFQTVESTYNRWVNLYNNFKHSH